MRVEARRAIFEAVSNRGGPIVPDISYGSAATATGEFESLVTGLIEKHNVRRVCDIGGGANPLLPEAYIQRQNLSYAILDISPEELAKAPRSYQKILRDITSPAFSLDEPPFDLVFSKMMAEHVKDGRQLHRNVLGMLAENGVAAHFFPTLYALPFLVNRLTPEELADKVAALVDPRDRYQHAKFPAYYSWCRGPSPGQIRKFEDLGYRVLAYKGFFGHPGYYRKLKHLEQLHNLKTGYLLRHPKPLFTSYAYVVLGKQR